MGLVGGCPYLGPNNLCPVKGRRLWVPSQYLLPDGVRRQTGRVLGYRNQSARHGSVLVMTTGLVGLWVLHLVISKASQSACRSDQHIQSSCFMRGREEGIRDTHRRFPPSPPSMPVIVHWIHSPSAPFCLGNRYATSDCSCRTSVGAAELLRWSLGLRLDGLSADMASSCLRLTRSLEGTVEDHGLRQLSLCTQCPRRIPFERKMCLELTCARLIKKERKRERRRRRRKEKEINKKNKMKIKENVEKGKNDNR